MPFVSLALVFVFACHSTSFLYNLKVVNLTLLHKMILLLFLVLATVVTSAPAPSISEEHYNTYANDYCANYLFAGHLNQNQARALLNAALEFLDGFHSERRRPTAHDQEAQSLLFMMTGGVHLGFVRPANGQFMKRPRLSRKR